jgi:serine/threonine-protein kinase
VAEIGLDVARGLSAALDQGLIHRDIKPQNIMLTRRGTAKILDLGLARSTLEDAPRRRSPPGRAAVVGTSGYMAPEQLDDPDHIDFRADIYSLGVTLYEAATGVPPFPTADARACAELHRSAPVPAPDALVAGIAPSLSRILLWMLEKSAARRTASYAILERALEDTKATL